MLWSALLLFACASPAAAQFEAEAAPNPVSKMRLVKFENTPFPYDGEIPEKGGPFLDIQKGDRKGHTSVRGGVYWQDTTYNEKRVLLAFPRGFDPAKPVTLVVYFHGNQARLDRDVVNRQQVARQVLTSGRNTVLIAPAFAVDALDSSSGRFWEPGMFRAFLEEAAYHLSHLLTGTDKAKRIFEAAPVVLVAYSGGYQPAAYSLLYGDADERVSGVVLMDALYGETDKFLAWRARKPGAFFVSAYSGATEGENGSLQRLLRDENVKYETGLPRKIEPGTIAFVPAKEAVHNDFVTRAWTDDPLRLVLSRVPRPTAVAAPPPAVAATPVPQDPNYIARMPRPRPASAIPVPVPPPTMQLQSDVTATTSPPKAEPTGFMSRWPETEFQQMPPPPKR